MNLFSKVREYLNNTNKTPDNTTLPSKNTDEPADKEEAKNAKPVIKTRIYSFESMDDFSDASRAIAPIYNDSNSLYKKPGSDRYYLILKKEGCSSVNFNKVCNILSEYAAKESFTEDSAAYFNEHGELIIGRHAIRVAAAL